MNREPEFVRSSFCSGGNCVEVAIEAEGVTCRDTSGGLTIYSHDEWRAFVAGVKAGEFDV
jgi:hypothetical protein